MAAKRDMFLLIYGLSSNVDLEGVEEINYQLGQLGRLVWVGIMTGVKRATEIAEEINPKFGIDPNLKDLVLFT